MVVVGQENIYFELQILRRKIRNAGWANLQGEWGSFGIVAGMGVVGHSLLLLRSEDTIFILSTYRDLDRMGVNLKMIYLDIYLQKKTLEYHLRFF